MTLVISMSKLLSFKHLIILVFFKEKTNYSNEQKFHKIDSIVKNRMLICSVLCSSLANKWFIYIWIITMIIIIIIIINIGNVCAYITEKNRTSLSIFVFSFCYYCWYCVHSKTWTKSIYPLITRWLSNHAFANASLSHSLDTIDQPQEWMDESLEKLDLTTTKNKWLDFQTQFIFFIPCCFVFCST